MRYALVVCTAAFSGLLASCGPATPEEARAANIAKCERQFGRMASDEAQGQSLCTCITDRLAEQGLEITDMLGSNRSKVEATTRSCAAQSGISLPA